MISVVVGFQNAAILWFHLPLLPRHWHIWHIFTWHMSIWHIYGTYACSQKNTLRTLQHRLSTVEVSEPMEMCTLGCTLY